MTTILPPSKIPIALNGNLSLPDKGLPLMDVFPLPTNLQSLYSIIAYPTPNNPIPTPPTIPYCVPLRLYHSVPIFRKYVDLLNLSNGFDILDYTLEEPLWHLYIKGIFPFPRSLSLLTRLQNEPLKWVSRPLCWHYLSYSYDLIPSPLPVSNKQSQPYLF